MKRINLLITMALLLFASMTSAQNITVRGVITDAQDNSTLPGASIKVIGTMTVSIADSQGIFSIQAPQGASVEVSYVGYKTKILPITGATLDIGLEPDAAILEEVMVVAYGTAKKSSFTGSATVVSGELVERPSSNITKALQGTAPGIQATSVSGQPGSEATVRIRGIGSVNAGSNPLYVLDGVPYDGNLNSINPEDIASMTVLKDAASAALYGSRGANGVIMITTKKGTKGKAVVNIKAVYGVSDRAVKDYAHVSTNDYFLMTWEALYNQGGRTTAAAESASNSLVGRLMGTGPNPYGPGFAKPVGIDGKLVAGATPLWDFNWTSALEQPARRTDISASISGGTNAINYYLSFAYLNDEGILIGSGFKRYSFRSNLSSDVNKWLTVGANVSYTQSDQNSPTSEDSNTGNVANSGRLIPGFYPIYEVNPDGSLKLDANGNQIPDYGAYRPASATPNWNLPATKPNDKQQILRDQITVRAFGEVSILPGLKFKSSYNFDLLNYNSNYYTSPNPKTTSPYGDASRSNTRTFSYTFNNLVTYNKTFGQDHELSVLAGMEAYDYDYKYLYAYRTHSIVAGFPELDAHSVLASASGYSDTYALVGYLSRVEYNYKQKAHISASFRRDGSSRFHPNNRWGNFWSIGASYRLSDENFIKQIQWINNLSLRASYGAQGNDQVGTYYASEGLYGFSSNLGQGALISSRLETPNLKWETNLNTNFGVDIGLFQNRLTFTAEYFIRQSKDLIFSRTLPPSMGYTSITENVGAMRNNGVEFDLKGYVIRKDDFSIQLGANLTHYKNVITKLPYDNFPASGTKKLEVGRSIYDFYMRTWAGVDPETGLAQWWIIDAKGEKTATKTFTASTLTYTNKSSLPDFYGGVNLNVKYKNVTLSAMAAYSVGGYIYNSDIMMIMGNGASPGRAWHKEMVNRWTPDNKYTDIPLLGTVSPAGGAWTSQSDRFLVDGSYLRLKNITLSYDLPKSLLNKIGFTKAQVYINGDNLFTITKGVQGMDPEQSIDGSTYYRYPAMRTTSVGINVSF